MILSDFHMISLSLEVCTCVFFILEFTKFSGGMEVVELALVPISAVLQQAPHLGTGAVSNVCTY